MTVLKPDNTLEDIRREIDAIDDAMVDLLIRRFAATHSVRAAKSSDGSLASSPLRPAREARMLRRLIERGKSHLSPQLLVRLWRVILSASTQSQAFITLHVAQALADSLRHRLDLAEHFCGMQIQSHQSTSAAYGALARNRGDLAIVMADSDWADAFTALDTATVQLISSLPVLRGGVPELFPS